MPISFFIQNRLHISFCALCLTWAFANILHVEAGAIKVIIVVLTITVIYQWNRLSDIEEDRVNTPEEYEYTIKHINTIKLMCFLFALILGGLSYFYFGVKILSIVLAGLLVGFFYGGYSGAKNGFRIKRIFLLKNMSSALGWTFGTIVFPFVIIGELPFSSPIIVLLIYSFLNVMNGEILWDIRDMNGDKINKVATIPTRIGIGKSFLLVKISNFLLGGLMLVFALLGDVEKTWLLLAGHTVIVHYAILVLEKKPFERRLSHNLVLVQSIGALLVGFVFYFLN